MSEQESKISILLRGMVQEELETRWSSDFFTTRVSSEGLHVLTIPAASHEVGDLEFWFHDDEVTVTIGKLFHSHFTPQLYEDWPSGKAAREAVVDAVDFVAAFIANEYVLRVFYRGQRCAGAEVCPVHDGEPASGLFPTDRSPHAGDSSEPEVRTEEYVWSGPCRPEPEP